MTLPTSALETPPRATDIADSLTSREWDELTDEVLRRLERRVTDDLARRGRRAKPRVL
ncbi:MAG: hypothetical protein J0I11_05160 [Actinobacteria bacterium]|jgi:hypothetical protein|nr:hypothetical protein [Actinomycetota bacterium]